MEGNIDRNVYGIYTIDFTVIIRNKTCRYLSRIENTDNSLPTPIILYRFAKSKGAHMYVPYGRSIDVEFSL